MFQQERNHGLKAKRPISIAAPIPARPALATADADSNRCVTRNDENRAAVPVVIEEVKGNAVAAQFRVARSPLYRNTASSHPGESLTRARGFRHEPSRSYYCVL